LEVTSEKVSRTSFGSEPLKQYGCFCVLEVTAVVSSDDVANVTPVDEAVAVEAPSASAAEPSASAATTETADNSVTSSSATAVDPVSCSESLSATTVSCSESVPTTKLTTLTSGPLTSVAVSRRSTAVRATQLATAVEQPMSTDEQQLQCADCHKSFRSQTLLDYHNKYYHHVKASANRGGVTSRRSSLPVLQSSTSADSAAATPSRVRSKNKSTCTWKFS